MHIPFNKPFLSGKETQYIQQAVESGKFPAMAHSLKMSRLF